MNSSGFFYSICVSVVLLFSSVGTSQMEVNQEAISGSSESSDMFFLCRRDKNVRWLRAYRLETGKCRALYSKEGYLQVISSATYFSSCEGVLQNVRKNLEEGGFKCSLMPSVSMIDFDAQ